MITGTCVLCFLNNIKVFNINNSHLQCTYEKISGFTIKNTYNVCYICCTRLQQFHSLIKQTESSVNYRQVTHTQLTTVKVENASIPYHTGIKQEIDIEVKVEKCSDDEDEVDVGFEDVPDIMNLQTVDKVEIGKRQKQSKINKKKRKEYCCDVCNKKFNGKSNLNNHKRVHTREPCVCHICGIHLTLKCNLKPHMMTHSQEKPFVCDICNKRFKRSDHLKLHKMTHSKSKPFSCDLCGIKFKRQSSLRAHKLLHVRDNVYICDYCDRKFNKKGNLKVHIMGHINQKPFKCSACHKSYVTKHILKLHAENHCPYNKAKLKSIK